MNRAIKKQGTKHEIQAKIALKMPLSAKERAYYLLFISTLEEAKNYIKNENN